MCFGVAILDSLSKFSYNSVLKFGNVEFGGRVVSECEGYNMMGATYKNGIL